MQPEHARPFLIPKGPAMRRPAAALALVALVALIVSAGAPANAVKRKGPTDAYPDLPSNQWTTWVQTTNGPVPVNAGYLPGTQAYDDNVAAQRTWMASKGYPAPTTVSQGGTLAVKGGKVPDISSLPKVVTSPTNLARAGGAAVSGFAAGFAIGEAGLLVYGQLTGQNPLSGACGDPFLEGVVSTLYMGMEADCALPIPDPNSDQPLTYGTLQAPGGSMRYVGPGTGTTYCYDLEPNSITLTDRWNFGYYTGNTYNSYGSGYSSYTTSRCPYGIAVWDTGTPPSQLILRQGSTGGPSSSDLKMSSTKPDPYRNLACAITWSGGSTTPGTGGSYRESAGASLGGIQSACKSAYNAGPAGQTPARIKTTSQVPGGATTTLQDSVATPAPDKGDGSGLVLQKKSGSSFESCLAGTVDCGGWWAASAYGTITTDYRCQFGGKTVDLKECYVYQGTFETAAETPTITDPVTGTTVEWGQGADPANSTDPTTGPKPGEACMSEWPSVANPVDWVFHPIKCAVVWSVVPNPTKLGTVQTTIKANWENSSPGKLSASVGSIGADLAALTDGDCGGLILAYPSLGAGWSITMKNAAMLPACPGDFFHPWAPTFYWFSAVGLTFGGAFAIKRLLDRFVGM